jgi:hypothetical protein
VGTGELGSWEHLWFPSSLTPFHLRWIRGKASPPNPPLPAKLLHTVHLSTFGGPGGSVLLYPLPPGPPKVERWTGGKALQLVQLVHLIPAKLGQVESWKAGQAGNTFGLPLWVYNVEMSV